MSIFTEKLSEKLYEKFSSLDYEKFSEDDMMVALDGVFGIDPYIKNGLFNEQKHYKVIDKIMMTSLKLKYTKVCDEFRKIYPLSFPDIEKHYPNPVPRPECYDITTLPMPKHPQTDDEKNKVNDLNKLTKSFNKKNK